MGDKFNKRMALCLITLLGVKLPVRTVCHCYPAVSKIILNLSEKSFGVEFFSFLDRVRVRVIRIQWLYL